MTPLILSEQHGLERRTY